MMEFRITARRDGMFALEQTQPVLIGTFPERETAERVMAFLVEEAMDALGDETVRPSGGETAPETRESRSADAPTTGGSTEPATHAGTPNRTGRTPSAGEPATNSLPVARDTVPELDAAFARIAAGETVTKVAADIGVPMPQLRAKYAASRKRAQRSAASDEPDMEDCKLCGKAFLPTPERLEMCARCDREI